MTWAAAWLAACEGALGRGAYPSVWGRLGAVDVAQLRGDSLAVVGYVA